MQLRRSVTQEARRRLLQIEGEIEEILKAHPELKGCRPARVRPSRQDHPPRRLKGAFRPPRLH